MKRFEYSPLERDLKVQTDIVKKQYQKLENTFELKKMIKKENYGKSNLKYDAYHNFSRYYHDRKKNDKFPFKSKNSFLNEFCDDFDK